MERTIRRSCTGPTDGSRSSIDERGGVAPSVSWRGLGAGALRGACKIVDCHTWFSEISSVDPSRISTHPALGDSPQTNEALHPCALANKLKNKLALSNETTRAG